MYYLLQYNTLTLYLLVLLQYFAAEFQATYILQKIH